MDKKCIIANERRHGTTCLKPIEVFLSQEVQTLKSLPTLSYECEEVAYPIVRKNGFVRFANKYYAVADSHIGKEAVVLGTTKRISIFSQGKLIETYDRITNMYQTHAIHDSLKKPWRNVEANNAHLFRMSEKIGPACSQMIRDILLRGDGFVDTRIIWGILSLDKKYDSKAIDSACAAALEIGKYSSRFVERLIRLTQPHSSKIVTKEKEPAVTVPLHLCPVTEGTPQRKFKFARPMSAYKERIKSRANPGLRVVPNCHDLKPQAQ